MMNTIESDNRYGCFIGKQFKESVVVKWTQRKKKFDDNNFENP